MVYDPLPELHQPFVDNAKHCNSDLPLAEFSSQTTSGISSMGLRKGFLSSSAAKPTMQVSHHLLFLLHPGSTCCIPHTDKSIPGDTEKSIDATRAC